MSGFEVQEPILNSPYEEPREHWRIVEGEEPQRVPGRRSAMYFYRPPGPAVEGGTIGRPIELTLVNSIRMQLDKWRPLALKGEGGVTRTTMELMDYWRRQGRGFKPKFLFLMHINILRNRSVGRFPYVGWLPIGVWPEVG